MPQDGQESSYVVVSSISIRIGRYADAGSSRVRAHRARTCSKRSAVLGAYFPR
ncbi:hypothetical protein ACFUNF_34020 [Streptomyces sp. NPDC057291]|uniref:hypothetical protein n=1 Tax=Streptomyces sp. NPDC057291 TaxID=3346087 RepID=UPI00363650C6